MLAALPPGEAEAGLFREYLASGRPDAAAVAAAIREQASAALASGYAGIRLVADMDWLLPARPSPGEITAYETRIDRVIAEAGAVVACAYRRSSFPRGALDGALAVHLVIRGRHASPQFRFTCSRPGQWRLSGEIDISVTEVLAAAFRAAVRHGGGEFLLGDQVHAHVIVLGQRPAEEPGGDGDHVADGGGYDAGRGAGWPAVPVGHAGHYGGQEQASAITLSPACSSPVILAAGSRGIPNAQSASASRTRCRCSRPPGTHQHRVRTILILL